MTQERWHDDEALLADLRQALAYGAPRDEALVEAGRAAFTWRTVDEELAALSYDSLLDDLSMVRGVDTAPRTLVFDAGALSVEVELDAGRLVGQLVPATAGEVVVQSQGAEVARATADGAGCFTARVPSGMRVRLRCTTESADVVTDWVST